MEKDDYGHVEIVVKVNEDNNLKLVRINTGITLAKKHRIEIKEKLLSLIFSELILFDTMQYLGFRLVKQSNTFKEKGDDIVIFTFRKDKEKE